MNYHIAKKILCVDDNEENLFVLKLVLNNHYKYKVITVKSADEALKVLLSENIDLILLDIMMPVIDGFEAAKLIKSNKNTSAIPIIFITAKKDEQTITKCFEVGGCDYISKPLNKEELIARIDFHLILVENSAKLEQEKLFVDTILNAQDSLICVVQNNKIIKSNNQFRDFFKYDILEVGNIGELFLDIEGYYRPDIKVNWIDEFYKLQDNDDYAHVVSIIDKNEYQSKSFIIKIIKSDNLYIVSLTDVTALDVKLHKYKTLATYDNLTKIYNRQTLNRSLQRIMDVDKKTGETFSFAIFDIDHFKLVNDNYGHLVGDEVLSHLAASVSKHIRNSDVFARWGGEEFVILIDKANIELSKTIVEHLRKSIEEEYFNEVKHITCSFGVTEFKANDDIKSLTKRADDALYEAKRGGRNRVCVL